MTIDSWRAAVGGSWSRMLLYPGGLTALGLALLLLLLWRADQRLGRHSSADALGALLLALAAPLVALGALPLSTASELRLPLDLPGAWLLLEVPALIVALQSLRAPSRAGQQLVARYLIGLLTAAPLLALVLAAFGALSGSLLLLQPPPPSPRMLVVAICWLLALPPLLQLGPWQTPEPASLALLLALQLRRAGHLALATLPWLARWPALEQLPAPLSSPAIGNKALFLASVLLLALLLAGADRLTRRAEMRRWALIYPPLGLLLLALLLQHAAEQLRAQLR